MFHLIQGVFFQNKEWLDTAMVPVEGMVAVIKRGLIWDMYAGIICLNPEHPGRFVGAMIDHYGESQLSDITLLPTEVSFVKKYIRRQDRISYVFKSREGLNWVGQYSGDVVGVGLSRCIITQVEDSFIEPHPIKELLGAKSIHQWPTK